MGTITGVARLSRLLLLVSVASLAGCYGGQTASTEALVRARDQVSDTGLRQLDHIDGVDVSAAVPIGWTLLPAQRNALYTHRQWRSPSKRTAAGSVHVNLLLPLGAKTVAWLATREYSSRDSTGQVSSRWTDDLGREWFEGDNDKYHVRGYIMVRGLDAWINYCGYRTREPKEPADIALSTRSMETILPLSVGPSPHPAPLEVRTPPATQPAATQPMAVSRQ